jgi:hypothetical protein
MTMKEPTLAQIYWGEYLPKLDWDEELNNPKKDKRKTSRKNRRQEGQGNYRFHNRNRKDK